MSLLDDGSPSMLRDAARRALSEAAPHRELTDGTGMPADVAARHWNLAVELGWTALLLPDSHDGMALGNVELVELCEEMGAQLFTGPWLASAVILPGLRRAAGESAPGDDWPGPADAACLAVRLPDRSRAGDVQYIGEHPDLATHYLFTHTDHQGRLVCQRERTENVTVWDRPEGFDPACPVAIVSPPAGGTAAPIELPILGEAVVPVHLAVAAELNGIASAALERSITWARERRQFSRAIGSFQAVKHRLADNFASFLKALTLTRAAATSGAPHLAVSARILAADAARTACRHYVQLLGGAGISWEIDAHLYLKRVARLEALPPSTPCLRRLGTDAFITRHAVANA